MSAPVVIAVDGTAACGKGTLARLLARHYGFAHLDSGALYRLVALGVIEANGDPSNETDAVKAARAIDPARSTDPIIRRDDVGRASSQVAAMPAVRRELFCRVVDTPWIAKRRFALFQGGDCDFDLGLQIVEGACNDREAFAGVDSSMLPIDGRSEIAQRRLCVVCQRRG